MNTIASHLALATIQAGRHLVYARPLAAAEVTDASAAATRMTLAVVILTIVILAALKSAIGTLAHLMAELLRAMAELLRAVVAIGFLILILVTATGVILVLLANH